MNIVSLTWVFLILCFSASVESHFSLICPRTVQYRSVYKCVLTSIYFNTDKATVDITLKGTNTRTQIDTLTEELKQDAEPINIEFDLSKHDPVENFTVIAELKWINGSYTQKVDVFVIPKRYSVFIQTDKPVYKPGDEILYRILVLDSDLKPYEVDDGKLEHAVYDGLGNRLPGAKAVPVGSEPVVAPPSSQPTVKDDDFDDEESNPASPKSDNFPDEKAPKENKNNFIDSGKGKITEGVYSYSYQISDEPIEGTWSINVTINDEHQFATIQQFKVERYILPRFQVFVDTKRHVNKDEGEIWLSIYANYTFGKYVNGKATVRGTVYDLQHPDKIQSSHSKDIDVKMKTTASFNMERDLKITNSIRPYQVKFDIEFKEDLTGQVGSANTTVKVHKYKDYQITIVRDKKKFKPGFPYAFEVQVMQADGQPAEKSTDSLKVTVGYHFKPLLCTVVSEVDNLMKTLDYTEQKLLVKGKARFVLDIPLNTTAFSIKAQYFESNANTNVLRHDAGSREYMTIEHAKNITIVKDKQIITPEKVGERFKIKIKLTIGVENAKIHYIVNSRFGIVAHRKAKANFNNDYTATIGIPATEEMSPTCSVIVYYIQPSGEVVYDQVKVDIPMDSLSTIVIKFQKEEETKMPGQSLKLLTKADPGSFVSLLGVDQSVKLLGHGNDIDLPRVSADMKLYDSSAYTPEESEEIVNAKYFDFSESNTFIITNALGAEKNCGVLDRLPAGKSYSLDDSSPDGFDDDDGPIRTGSEVRKVFPETWIFKDFKIDRSGKFILNTIVPDTITSFVVSGFAVHPEHGLAIATPTKITVFKEFFAKLYVPYSLRLGEILKVDVSVFNYLSDVKREIQATVVLDGQKEFEFVNVDMKTCTFTPAGGIQSQSRTISVPYDNGAATYFLIRAKKVGLIKLAVHATTTASQVKDNLEKLVKVEREGYRVTSNEARNIDMRNIDKPEYSNYFQISFPTNCIGDSFQISTSVIGDLLGPALVNINSLMRMPSGCTEQTFKSFIPNIVAMKYLKATDQLTAKFKTDGEKYLAFGYQELLKRRLSDGSFSLWGEKDAKSVWLTAYVAKVLAHTKELVAVDAKHITSALEFIKKHQNAETGGFSDSNVHQYIYISKTASQRGLALTAFIAIAFLENEAKDYKAITNKMMTYISEHVASLKDSLSMSMAAYAFALHGNKNETLKIFDDLARMAALGDTMMYWEHSSPSIQVETAAYAVLAMVKVDEAHRALPIVNWMVSQRQASGGFYATTDTVIGVQALALYATAIYAPQKTLDITLSDEKDRKTVFNITAANAKVLQSKGLKADGRRFALAAKGKGFAHFQLSYSCNVNVEDPERKFEIKAVTVPTGNENLLHLKICASFVPTGGQTQTGMTLLEVYLPSGYEYDSATENLVKNVGVKRVETAHQKTVIVLYFNSLTSASVCPEIKATRKSVVKNLRSSPVKIYDYYNKNLRASTFFSVEGNEKCGF